MSFNNINRNSKNWKPEQADVINNIINRVTENINSLDVPDLDYKSNVKEIPVLNSLSNNSIKIDNRYFMSFSFDDYTKIKIPLLNGCIFNIVLKAFNNENNYEVFMLKNGRLVKLSDFGTTGPYFIKTGIVY